MKKILFLTTILLLGFASCTKDNGENQIEIHYSIEGWNTSPLLAALSINKDVHYTEWSLNGKPVHLDCWQQRNTNFAEILLTKPGKNVISLFAVCVKGNKYRGKVVINVPNVAQQLVVKGFRIEGKELLNIESEKIAIRFAHTETENRVFVTKTYYTHEFMSQNEVYFSEPIVLDVFQSNNHTRVQIADINFSISNIPTPLCDALAGYPVISYRGYFYALVCTAFAYHDRVWTRELNRIRLWSGEENITAFLLVEWK